MHALRYFFMNMQKRLLPYLKRADELEAREPLASFYCRLYVADQLLTQRSPESDAALMAVLDDAERLKPGLGPGLSTEGPQAFEQFSREIFDAAVEAESAGLDAVALATKYYFSSLFFDVMTQFGPLSTELEEKRSYARSRVMQLRRGGVVRWAEVRARLQAAAQGADAEDAGRVREALRSALDLLG